MSEYKAIKINRGANGWGGPLTIVPTETKNKILVVTGGGFPPLAQHIAKMTGCELVDGFKTTIPDEEVILAIVDCGGTARCGVYPKKGIFTVNLTSVGKSGPLAKFITEEIYLQLFNIDESIMISKFPQFDEKYNFKADEEEIEKLKEIIIGIRNLRASSNVHPSKKTELIFVTTKYKYLINQSEGFLKKLGYSENIKVQENKEGIAQNALSIITDGIELYIPFEELVDIEEERKRMEEEKKKVIAEIERASKMLSNPGFVNKAPEAKINEEKAKLEKYQNMLKNLEERLK